MRMIFLMMLVEWKKIAKEPVAALSPVMFFVMLMASYPLMLPAGSEVVSSLAPLMLWVVFLCAAFLSAARIFSEDYTQGVLALWHSKQKITCLVWAKYFSHLLLLVLPVAFLLPILLPFLGFSEPKIFFWILVLTGGALSVSAWMIIAAALLLASERAGQWLVIVVLPWILPAMMFASNALSSNQSTTEAVLLLFGLALIAVPLMGLVVPVMLRIIIEE